MYRKILVPVDGSPTCDEALVQAAQLARLCSARLRLLHVIDSALYASGFETAAAYRDDVRPFMQRTGRQVLDRARAAVADAGIEVETAVVEATSGRVADTIVSDACSAAVDLVVMGTHGRRGVDRLLMGSDAEGVARASPVPVLLVRSARSPSDRSSAVSAITPGSGRPSAVDPLRAFSS